MTEEGTKQPTPVEPTTPPGLVAVLYDELRKLAAARMAREYGPQTLQSTALVHEAWLRLGADKQPHWKNRAQFFAAAAEAMRRILLDRARRRRRLRHGGEFKRTVYDTAKWQGIDSGSDEHTDNRIIALHEALEGFALEDPKTAELVKLRYFIGMSVTEAAEAMDITDRTARRWLAYAKAWLAREMQDEKN